MEILAHESSTSIDSKKRETAVISFWLSGVLVIAILGYLRFAHFKAVQRMRCKAWYRVLTNTPKSRESAVGAGLACPMSMGLLWFLDEDERDVLLIRSAESGVRGPLLLPVHLCNKPCKTWRIMMPLDP
jgi:hypothetical protein